MSQPSFTQYACQLPERHPTTVMVYFRGKNAESEQYLKEIGENGRQLIAIQLQLENHSEGERTGPPERTWRMGTFLNPPIRIRYLITYTPDTTKRPPDTPTR